MASATKLIFASFICTLAATSVAPAEIVNFNFPINASQETNGSASAGAGTGILTFDTVTNELSANITWSGLDGAGEVRSVHFHRGLCGENGPHQLDVVPPVTMAPFITSPAVGGPFVLTNAQEADLLAGLWYVNIHTNAYTTGEIRGQAYVQGIYTFDFPLTSLQENNGSTSGGIGKGKLVLDTLSNEIDVTILWDGLDPPNQVTKVHVHRGRCAESGPVQFELVPPAADIPSPIIVTRTITPAQAADILCGLWYINIHTAAWPTGEIRGQVMNAALGSEQLQKLTAADGALADTFGKSVALTNNYAVVGSPLDDDGGTDAGSVYVFARVGLNWVQLPKITAFDRASGDNFGFSVSIGGDTIVVGAPNDDDGGSNTGSIYFYTLNINGTPDDPGDDSWTFQAKVTAADRFAGDNFGFSVGIDGDDAIVGAILDDDTVANSGSAYIYHRTGIAWAQQAKLHAGSPALNARFGYSVDIDGDSAIVGAEQPQPTAPGAAYVFLRTGVVWAQQTQLMGSDVVNGDRFGTSVGIDGEIAIVGAPLHSDVVSQTGSAYIFKRNGTAWANLDKIVANDAEIGENFGYSVDAKGDLVLVGARRGDGEINSTGAAYAYRRGGTCWVEMAKYFAGDGLADDEFGSAVALTNIFVMAGAPTHDAVANNAGAAYIFLAPDSVDCNGNDRNDTYDILIGFSEDCNFNGVPDECQSPCITCADDCYEACGVLVANPTPNSPCPILFQPDGTTIRLVLDKLETFVVGDRVRVEGCLDASCVTTCPESVACLHCNTIRPCDPCFACQGPCFDGCGELIQSGNCIKFRADSGGDFYLDNLGDFFVTDHVRIRGCLDPNCPMPCGVGDCIKNNVIESCRAGCEEKCEPHEEECFTGCGTIIATPDCRLFQADAGGRYLLSNYDNFQDGARVEVVGCVDADCTTFCNDPTVKCLHNELIRFCQPCSNCFGPCLEACGELVQVGDCTLFQSDVGGYYVLENFGDFVVGDHIRVAGCLQPGCLNNCPPLDLNDPPFQCVVRNSVETCGAGCREICPQDETCFSSCGSLVQGPPNCPPIFQSDSGGRYILSNIGNFNIGARVQVEGCVDPDCGSPCLDPDLQCLHNHIIKLCDPCQTCFGGPCMEACGELVQVGECVLFQGDTGGYFVLENHGDFVIGDHVRVSGCLQGGCLNACPPLDQNDPPFQCLVRNSIETCGAGCREICPVDQPCFSACGVLMQGPPNCPPIFRSDNGGDYILSNYGFFNVPPVRVQIEGCINENCDSPCADPNIKCIHNHLIKLCDPCVSCFGPCIDECGELVQVGECVVFQGDTGGYFVLENHGDFVVGDHIRVVGCLQGGCLNMCPPPDLNDPPFPCIVRNSVESCGAGCREICPVDQPCFTGCGVIEPGPNCLYFRADSGGRYILSNYGFFTTPGVRVQIEGCINPNCATPCLEPDVTCLHNHFIRPCDPCLTCFGPCLDLCGELVQVGDCTLFQTDIGGYYVLENHGNFVVGDHVRIVGCIQGGCLNQCPPPDINDPPFPCIVRNSIESCGAGCREICPVDQPCLSTCGTIILGGNPPCPLFQADSGGLYVLSNLAFFGTPGARVEVQGCVEPDCASPCAVNGVRCFHNKLIRLCDPCQSCFGPCVDACGELVQVGECIAFRTGFGFPTFESDFLIDNMGDYGIGDLVRIRGCIQGGCPSACFVPGNPFLTCITRNSIEPCGRECSILECPPSNNCIAECGLLVNTGVIEFHAQSGGRYLLSNLGNFPAGANVEVIGCVDTNCASPFADPNLVCLQNESIRLCPCMPCPLAQCFESCGLLYPGPTQDCRMFHADTGDIYQVYGITGPYQPGDRVFLSGCVNSDCGGLPIAPCAGATAGCLIIDQFTQVIPCDGSCRQNDCLPQDRCKRTCGQLLQGVDCMLFQEFLMPDSFGAIYSLDNVGSFVPGDVVYVTGCADTNIDLPCSMNQQLPVTRIPANTIDGPACRDKCSNCAIGDGCFTGCGLLYLSPGSQCLMFHADSGEIFAINGSLNAPFGPGDHVFLRGCVTQNCNQFQCGLPLGPIDCLTVQGTAVICQLTCPPPCQLGQCREMCGQLVQGVDCVLFNELLPGNIFGNFYSLDNLGAFQPGDMVFVTGCAETDVDIPCSINQGISINRILDNTIDGPACRSKCVNCPENDCFAGCGTLVLDGQCLVFEPDTGGTYQLTGNMGPFGPGDKIYVRGCINQFCFNPLNESGGCIPGSHPCINLEAPTLRCGVDPCSTCPQNCFDECGTLVQDDFVGGAASGGNCILFEADGGNRYAIQNAGLFNLGDRVRIRGCLDPFCGNRLQGGIQLCSTGPDGCITNNSIEACANACATCPGDVNGDNQIDGNDIQQFINCVLSQPPLRGGQIDCTCADVEPFNSPDGDVDLDDVAAFIDLLLSGVPCNAP
jgi:hypothetical protein